MDPYLEKHWPDVHARLGIYACDALRRQMPAGLIVRVEEYMSVVDDEQERLMAADVRIHELGNPHSSDDYGQQSKSGVAVAEPLIIEVEIEPATSRTVLVLDTRSNNRVVTAIEFLSPANKIGKAALERYADRRARLIAGGAHFVEIDLVRRGGHPMLVDPAKLSPDYAWPYWVCVVRRTERFQAELYQATYRRPLPAIKIPLRPADPDAILELQPLIDRAYVEGQYDQTIDYRVDPEGPFEGDDLSWIDAWLCEQKWRT
jgi:hypothetical protein